jgi:hypothetical protein
MGLADKLKRAVASNFFTEEESVRQPTPTSTPPPATPSLTIETFGEEKVEQKPKPQETPKGGMTALQISEMIDALPESMPTRSKRLTVRAMIDAQASITGVKAEHLLAEAMLNKIQLTQRLQQREAGHRAIMAQLNKILAEYTEEQSNIQQQLDSYERVAHFLSAEVGNEGRAGVPPPMSTPTNFSTASSEEKSDNELPPHLRDGEVRKLLGIP